MKLLSYYRMNQHNHQI